jgi:hypothetical protein
MTSLATLAPDQRAVLELVLRQGRSYGELSELLGIPEREVRERAESALRALAGDPSDSSVDTGRITDWMLGQQTDRAAAATAEKVGATEAARAWAADVAEQLREVGGERVPAVPGDDVPGGDAAAPPEPAAPRPRPLRDAKPAPKAATATATNGAAAVPPAAAGPGGGELPRVSRVGGAALIGVIVLILVALLVWPVNLLGLGGGDSGTAASSANAQQPTATPTATATPGTLASQATGNDIVLKGTGSTANAEGLMRLFKSQSGLVQFAIGVQNIPNNAKGESYAVWFTGKGVKPRLLGFPQTQVTNNVLTVSGPTKADEKAFPAWFATYDKVLITKETSGKPKQPGPVVVSGTLPRGKG